MEPAVQLPAHDSGSDSGCSASSTSVGKRAYDKDGRLVSVFGSRTPRKPRTHSRTLVGKVFKAWATLTKDIAAAKEITRTHSRTLVGKVFKAWATLIKDIAAAEEISSDENPWASLS